MFFIYIVSFLLIKASHKLLIRCPPRVNKTLNINCKSDFKLGVAKLQPSDQFNLACQVPYTFFSSTTFPTVDSSATALATASIN